VIFIFNPFSKEPIQPPKLTPLTTMPGLEYNSTFSPNGIEIAYSWNGANGENFDIYVKTIGTVGCGEQLTNHPGHDFSPAWSPDGRYIAFIRYFEGNFNLYTIQARGGQETLLKTFRYPLEYSSALFPKRLSWSADSKFLAFPFRNSNEEPFRILSINVESLKIETLTHPPSQFVGDTYPAFSPDGKRLAFVRYLTGFSSEIYIQTYPKGIPHPITSDNKRIWGLTWTRNLW
jgi:Tol biopolymer transport system component